MYHDLWVKACKSICFQSMNCTVSDCCSCDYHIMAQLALRIRPVFWYNSHRVCVMTLLPPRQRCSSWQRSDKILTKLNPEFNYDSPNYVEPRNKRNRKQHQTSAMKHISVAAQLMGDYGPEMQAVQSSKDTVTQIDAATAQLEAQFEHVRRLESQSKPVTWFVRERELRNDLEVQNSLVEQETADEVQSYSEYLRTLHNADDIRKTKVKEAGTGQIVELLGTPDPAVPMSSVPCQGCGAKLHCQDPAVPGTIHQSTCSLNCHVLSFVRQSNTVIVSRLHGK